MRIIEGDILTSPARFIAHQCKCQDARGSGVADAIFRKWPKADDYARHTHGSMGTIHLHEVAENKVIINMFAQYSSGVGNLILYPQDAPAYREEAFQMCLDAIRRHLLLTGEEPTISFPYKIGCMAAGGDWERYELMLRNFEAGLLKVIPKAEITLYNLKS